MYNLCFTDLKTAAKNRDQIYADGKDDPMGETKVYDDFGHEAVFRPNDVIAILVTDVSREIEAQGEKEIIQAKTSLRMQQKARQDGEIQEGIARKHASEKLVSGIKLAT
jgi:hypothetical protein